MTEELLKDDFDSSFVVLLIRWLQHDMSADNGKSYTIEMIAEALDTNRDRLNRFLSQKLKRDEEKRRAREYAVKLKPVLDQARRFPPAVLELYAAVYKDAGPVDHGPDKPVQRIEAIRHQSMSHVSQNGVDVTPLVGLSALVRTSNDYVPAPEEGEQAVLPGWSISLLNVLPNHVQKGLNHPLFVLRQKGLQSNQAIIVEGVVVALDDRFVLEGIERQSLRPFQANLPVPDRWQSYRDHERSEPIFGSGVMLGLSSQRGVFAGLFDLFAIPRSVLGEKATPFEKTDFSERYRGPVRNSVDVRDLQGTVEELQNLGIQGGQDWLKQVLRDMRERAQGRLLLKP